MGSSRTSSRNRRVQRRPDLERLENRQLLSLTDPAPAAGPSARGAVRADGSVNFDAVIQASSARTTYAVDGTGSNVAVIDTGVDAINPAFGTGSAGQAGNKVVAGVDFTGSPQGIMPTWQHGTGVAGLIGSTDPTNPGVAPGAGIVALRVFGDDNQGSFDRIEQALDWVIQNHAAYNITAVNLSVSDGGNYASNQFATDGSVGQAITNSVRTLAAINIPVVVAAGNNFDGKTQGQGFAAIIPETISVTATDETKQAARGGDVLAADAQRLGTAQGGVNATDIAAPGVDLIAPSGHSGVAADYGTSFAAPQVTGAVVLLQQMYRRAYGSLPTVAQVDAWLQAGADTIRDGVTGIDVGRLNVANSLGILSRQIAAVAQARASVAAPVVAAQVLVAAPAVPATPAITPPATTASQAAVAEPMTEVIVNGASLGAIATSQLSARFARLFALTNGQASSLRAWTSAGSTVDLGTLQATGRMIQPRRMAATLRVPHGASVVRAAVLTPATRRRSTPGERGQGDAIASLPVAGVPPSRRIG